MYSDPDDLDFFDWLETLDDEQLALVYEDLMAEVDELGISIRRQPLAPHPFLNSKPRFCPKLLLN